MLGYKKLNIITGHYGSGKTNVAVNLALMAKKSSPDSAVKIADIDIVNPYFRTADSRELLEKNGIEVLIPEFANTNVDIPSLPPKILTMFEGDDGVISVVDVGGDDGAVALGMYRDMINAVEHEIFYVINMYRPLISDPRDAAECMRDIESISGLKVTKIINNSSLGAETTAKDVADSIEYAKKCAQLCSVPLACHTYCPEYAPTLPTLLKDEDRGAAIPINDITKKLF